MTIIQNNSGKSTTIIESVNPKMLSQKDLEKIVEIEQDMWAREDSLGEYVKCKCCNKIHSKEDIFGHLEKDIKIQTVKKIENIIDFEIVCPDCNGQIKTIYDRNEYIESIRSRYNNTIESFLTVYRDNTGEIRGFMDGYIDNFRKIFDKELFFHFEDIGEFGLKKYINSKGYSLTENLFTISSLGIEEEYKNFFITFDLIKYFALSVDSKYDDLSGIFEAIVGSNTYKIFISMGANRVYINNILNNFGLNNNETDILIHYNLVKEYKTKFNIPVMQFLRENKRKIR
ncbi:MAG: hypothetical protein PHG82_04250 [Candidatus Gracilibacteria bacterium]|nr:hypothetical protein [Candidatus Gracilibacteria bacterium]